MNEEELLYLLGVKKKGGGRGCVDVSESESESENPGAL